MGDVAIPGAGLVERQVRLMRWCLGIGLAGPVAAAVLSFLLPRMRSTMLSPVWVTMLAGAAALWLAFSANSDARQRLEHVKRGFAAHADRRRLLREYLLVYLLVLFRLELMAVVGVLIAGWGAGPGMALFVHLAALAMMLLSWPNRRKVELLVARAEAKRSVKG